MPVIICIDTETGGLNPDTDALLEVALVSYINPSDPNSHETKSLRFYVNEEDQMGVRSERAAEVHGITDETIQTEGHHLTGACTLVESYLAGIQSHDDVLIAGHHVSFDAGFIRRLFRLADRPIPRVFTWRLIDTFTLLAAEGFPTSLDAALEHFRLGARDPEAKHSALTDATKTLALLRVLSPHLFGVYQAVMTGTMQAPPGDMV